MDIGGTARVAIVGHTAERGGAELALLQVVRSLDRSKITPIVVLFADGPLVGLLEQSGVEVRVLPLDQGVAAVNRFDAGRGSRARLVQAVRVVGFGLRLLWLLRQLDVDVVHANTLKAFVIGGPTARLLRKPLVWWVHDRISVDYLPGRVARVLRWGARHLASRVIANSEATLATLGPLSEGRWRIAYPGVPDELLIDPSLIAPATSPPVVGIVGRISPTKGQDVFLAAAALVRTTHPQARFRIIGSAMFDAEDFERDVRALSAELGLVDVVEWSGFVEELPTAFRELTVAVHASPVPEPFGMVVTEAMAIGVPIIATRGGGASEIVCGPPGEVGLLVPPRDPQRLATAIGWVLDHPAEATQMAGRARTHVARHFSAWRTTETVTAAWLSSL